MKVKCDERHCGWHGLDDEILIAPNPFDSDEMLQGCPNCKQVNCMLVVCDEPDCWSEVSCGWPTLDGEPCNSGTGNGYQQTCGKHMKHLK